MKVESQTNIANKKAFGQNIRKKCCKTKSFFIAIMAYGRPNRPTNGNVVKMGYEKSTNLRFRLYFSFEIII